MKFTEQEISEYKEQKVERDKLHQKRKEKYEQTTRQKTCFKVYMHVNKHNGRKYIGITCEDVNSRWRGGKGYKVNGHFKNAIKKYGWEEGFEHLVLFDGLTQQEAMDKEVELISKYRNTPEGVYNITSGGEHYIQTPETIAKIKETKRKNLTPERLEKIRKAAQARDFKEENNPFYGKQHSQQTKQTMSKNHWSKTNPEKFYNTITVMREGANNPAAKQIIKLNDETVYSCIKECSDKNHIKADTVTHYCKGKRAVYLYMYKEDYDNLCKQEQNRLKQIANDFLNNPKKYNKANKKIICLLDGKVFNNCEECGAYYGLTKTQVGYQCRTPNQNNPRVNRKFMYLEEYNKIGK